MELGGLMEIILCTCPRYSEPHDHARATYRDPSTGNWRTHVTRPDGGQANVGDVVRVVDWREQARKLAEAAQRFVNGGPLGSNVEILLALDDYERAEYEADRVVG
jgi:hypothetical protein